jgi:REP element-mobilizing transposase RayT
MTYPHLGWRTRGYTPHYDGPGELQHIVFRLADSLPSKVVEELRNTQPKDRLLAAETGLDAGVGSRSLADPRVAGIVGNALRHFDRQRYELQAWCVMPTHVHVLALQMDGWPLAGVVHSWKSFTAHAANELLGRCGPFWARDYFDRGMRSERHAEHAAGYIEANPVTARLCASPEDWPWSSAFQRSV